MRKRIVVLGLVLTQAAALFATEENADSTAAAQVSADSTLAAPDSAVAAEPVAPVVPEVVIPDSVISDDNDLYELEKQKMLPEYRWTTIGVTLGGGVAMYRSTPANNSSAACIRAGLNFDVPIGQYFSLQPELLFATRGGGFQVVSVRLNENLEVEPANVFANDLEEHLFYFDVPINCKFSKRMNFSRQTTGRAFVSAGPVLSLGVFGKSEGDGLNTKLFQNDSDHEHQVACYKNFDFSFNFRLGYDFDSGYSIMAGYQLGLVNLMNNEKFEESERKDYSVIYASGYPEVRNSSIYVSLGYRW